MTQSPTGIIPQEWNEPRHIKDVKRFLRSLDIAVQDRRELLFGWARNVGVKLRPSDYDALEN